MTGPVRSHRRGTPVTDLLWVGGLIAGGLVGLILLRVAVAALGDLTDGVGCVVLIVAALGVWAAKAGLRRRRHRRAVRDLAGWIGAGGWEPVTSRPWPWRELVRWPDTVTVLRAYRRRVEGFVVVTGELAFTENGPGATVDRRDGHAAFAVVTLPQPAPSMPCACTARRPGPGTARTSSGAGSSRSGPARPLRRCATRTCAIRFHRGPSSGTSCSPSYHWTGRCGRMTWRRPPAARSTWCRYSGCPPLR